MTWPNFKRGSDRYGTQVIIDECKAGHDVQYGKTKVFIRSPQTLFELEKRRSDKIPSICITLQRVRFTYLYFILTLLIFTPAPQIMLFLACSCVGPCVHY